MNVITQLRSMLDCSQTDIGLLLGLHRVSVNRMERGLQDISGPALKLLERYLGEARNSPDAVRAEIARLAAGPISMDPAGAPAGVDDPPVVAPAGEPVSTRPGSAARPSIVADDAHCPLSVGETVVPEQVAS